MHRRKKSCSCLAAFTHVLWICKYIWIRSVFLSVLLSLGWFNSYLYAQLYIFVHAVICIYPQTTFEFFGPRPCQVYSVGVSTGGSLLTPCWRFRRPFFETLHGKYWWNSTKPFISCAEHTSWKTLSWRRNSSEVLKWICAWEKKTFSIRHFHEDGIPILIITIPYIQRICQPSHKGFYRKFVLFLSVTCFTYEYIKFSSSIKSSFHWFTKIVYIIKIIWIERSNLNVCGHVGHCYVVAGAFPSLLQEQRFILLNCRFCRGMWDRQVHLHVHWIKTSFECVGFPLCNTRGAGCVFPLCSLTFMNRLN